MAVTSKRDGACLIITIDNPPVNALGHAVRAGIMAALEIVAQDLTIQGVVLTGAGKFFSAGADISEFGKPIKGPHLPDVLVALETCRVPVVAALPGTALGGGLETALACRYRIGTSQVKAGLPEVNLGLIPGAGGTQRLPRLVGMKHAATFVSTGKPVNAATALEMGILDQCVDGELIASAMMLAHDLASTIKAGETLRAPLSMAPAPDDWDADWFEEFYSKTSKKARGQLSPLKTLDAVKAACTLDFEEGMQREREIFKECMASDQRAGLIHAFFAERQATKIEFLKTATPRKVETIGILGAGTMGSGIAIACATAGYEVRLYDTKPDALKAGLIRVADTFADSVQKGRLSHQHADAMTSRVKAINGLSELQDAELIIEAILERMDVKQSAFKELDAIARPDTILASNTSYLNVDEIAQVTDRPQDVIGMHFFSPANIMRLLEIVQTDAASPDALATAFAVARKLGKVAVLSGVCDGFIGNRILKKYRQQAEYIVEDGAMPWDVDRVMRGFGFAMGPFQVADLAGIDIGWHNRRREDETRDPEERYVPIADRLYEEGRLGQKTGAGWYDYKQGDRTPHLSAHVEDLVLANSKEKSITRREIKDDEILEALMGAMIAEGKAILDEGIAQQASDIDLVMIHGYGFPKYRGGLMFYAEHGASEIKAG